MRKLTENPYFWIATYICTWLILCMPVLFNDYPVMTDFINHLSRQYIRFEYNNVPAFKEYYSYQWLIRPNLATDIIITGLLPFFGIYTAGKIFICLTLGLWIACSAVMQKLLFGNTEIMPLFSALIVYNCMFTWGFSGSFITIPLALTCFALWIYTDFKKMNLFYRVALFIVLTFIIYVGHLFIFLFLGLLIGCYELDKCFTSKKYDVTTLTKNLSLVALSFSAALIHFAYFITQESLTHGEQYTYWGLNPERLLFSLMPDQSIISLIILGFIALVIFDLFTTKIFFNGNIYKANNSSLPLAALCFCIFFMPMVVLGVHFISLRIPAITILFLSGIITCTLKPNRKLIFIGAIIFLVTLQSIHMTYKWRLHNNFISNMIEISSPIKEGEKALILYDKSFLLKPDSGMNLIWNIASFLTIENHAYVPNTFKVMGEFFTTKPEYKHISPPYHDPILIKRFIGLNFQNLEPEYTEAYFSLSPDDYDYFIIIGLKEIPKQLNDLGEIKAYKEKITLLKLNH